MDNKFLNIKTVPRIFVGTIIGSLILYAFFGPDGLFLMKWLGYLFFACFIVLELRKFLRIHKKATIVVVISVVAVSLSLQLMAGYGLGLLLWFVGFFAVYEVLSEIYKGVRGEWGTSGH